MLSFPKKYLLLGMLLFFSSISSAQLATQSEVTIGLLIDGDEDIVTELAQQVKEETLVLLKNTHEVHFPEQYTLYGDFNLRTLSEQFEYLINEPGVDLIITIGPNASQVAASRKKYPKPVIAGNIISPEMQQVPVTADSTSGMKNFTFVSSPFSPSNDLKTFYELFPYTKIAILINRGISQLIPMDDYLQSIFKEFPHPVDYVIIETDKLAQPALGAIPSGVDAVYGAGLLQMSDEEYQLLIDGINQRKLPSFSLFGLESVKMGFWAGMALPTNFDRLSRRIAINVQRLLKGEKAENIPFTMSYQFSLVININTAYKIDMYPNWQTLYDAELVGEKELQRGEELTLKEVIEEVMAFNLDVRSADKKVSAGKQKILEKRAALLPQIAAQMTFLDINFEIPGIIDINNLYIGALVGVAEQMIYNERKVAEFAIERFSQIERNESRRQVQLDVVEEVSQIYLDVLKAKITVTVQEENVALSRKNLQLAKTRFQVGFSGPSDVYRFESELATSRSRLVGARNQLRSVEQRLNQVLNRPVNTYFNTDSVGLNYLDLLYLDPRIKPIWDNPKQFEKLADFMIRKARFVLPELGQIDARIKAQERFQTFSRRQFYLPNVRFQMVGFYNVLQEGAGLGGPPDDSDVSTQQFNYLLVLQAQYPIFIGLRRKAQYQRSKIELDQLDIERENLLLSLELKTRRKLNDLKTSFANITYFKIAEEAAFQNLEIVQDAYSKGQETLIRLLDAQNQTIRARELSYNAIYSFLSDLITFERTLGFYTFLMTPTEKEAYINEILLFIKDER